MPITISSVNSVTPINAQYFIDNQNNQSIIDYIDGRTTEFDAYYPVNPGQSYHIRLAIADGSDQQLNSYVWLNNFSSTDFTPNVLFSLSDSTCSSKSDLYVTVEQDSFEVDIDSSSFFSDRGYIDFSSLSVGDTLGYSSIDNYSSIIISDLIINTIISGSELLLESIDQVTGLSIGTFLVKNIIGGGVEIISVNVADADNFTSAYSNLMVFYNFIVNSNNSLNFSSNLVSEFQANRPPYVNDSISWYNFEEPSKELKAQYGLNYTRFRYQPWYGLKFDLTTEEISLKVVLWRDQLPGAYDDNLPEDPRGDSFVARIHDSSGNVSPWCDYYINTSDIHIKEWCDEHGLTFPYDYDNKTIRDKVWIWGIVFNFDTGEVTHVKAYERNYN